jgi:hypothetical protein
VLKGHLNEKIEILTKARYWLKIIGINKGAAEDLVPHEFAP